MGRTLYVYLFANAQHYNDHKESLPDENWARASGARIIDAGILDDWVGSVTDLERIFFAESDFARTANIVGQRDGRSADHYKLLAVIASVISEAIEDNCNFAVFSNC